jgi:hypothetical protein
MNAFIEKTRGLLRFYSIATRIIGWVFLIVALVTVVVWLLSGFPEYSGRYQGYRIYSLCERVALNFALFGLVVLGLSQFIRYLYDNDCQPGWLLRHGDKVLYLYAAALIASSVLYFFFRTAVLTDTLTVPLLFLHFLAGVVPAVAKALIFAGLGQILRRIVPMIEESKTLV